MSRILASLILCLGIALSPAHAKISLEDQFFNSTEIEQYIEDFPVLADYGFKKQVRGAAFSKLFPANKMSKLKRLFRFPHVDQYKDLAQDKLTSMFTAEEIKQIVSWKHSGFGKRLQRLIKFSHTVDGMDQMKTFFTKQQPTKKQRLKDIKQLAKDLREVELLINISAQTQTTIQVALETVTKENPREFKDIFTILRKVALKNQKNAKKFVHAELVYTYRTLLDRDMRKYLEFSGSALGKKYYKSRQRVITWIISKMSHDLSVSITKLVVRKKAGVTTESNPQEDYQEDFLRAQALFKKGQYATAVPIFERIGKQGHIQAQYYLGRSYNEGRHVNLNEMVAYAWFNLAGGQGHKQARKIANKMFGNFSMVTISKAGRMSRQYKNNYHADAEKRRKKLEAEQNEKAQFEADLAANKAFLQKKKALNSASSEEKKKRRRLAKRSAKHRHLLLERYPLPELMGKAPTIITEAD